MNQVIENKDFSREFPEIYAIILCMGSSNGLFHREADQKAVVDAAISAFQADGVDTDEVRALEAWLKTLTAEQKDTLSDGEETEIEALVQSGPYTRNLPVALLFDDAYNAMTVPMGQPDAYEDEAPAPEGPRMG